MPDITRWRPAPPAVQGPGLPVRSARRRADDRWSMARTSAPVERRARRGPVATLLDTIDFWQHLRWRRLNDPQPRQISTPVLLEIEGVSGGGPVIEATYQRPTKREIGR